MHVFIVRPFGIKNGVDFERVEKDLIRPAMAAAGLTGGTTGEFIEQGTDRVGLGQRGLAGHHHDRAFMLDEPRAADHHGMPRAELLGLIDERDVGLPGQMAPHQGRLVSDDDENPVHPGGD